MIKNAKLLKKHEKDLMRTKKPDFRENFFLMEEMSRYAPEIYKTFRNKEKHDISHLVKMARIINSV